MRIEVAIADISAQADMQVVVNSANANLRLGSGGDIAEADMEVLADHYLVDLSGFEFEKFFPPEFAGKSPLARVLLWIVPFIDKVATKSGEYLPLTLEMIERAMQTKQWRMD